MHAQTGQSKDVKSCVASGDAYRYVRNQHETYMTGINRNEWIRTQFSLKLIQTFKSRHIERAHCAAYIVNLQGNDNATSARLHAQQIAMIESGSLNQEHDHSHDVLRPCSCCDVEQYVELNRVNFCFCCARRLSPMNVLSQTPGRAIALEILRNLVHAVTHNRRFQCEVCIVLLIRSAAISNLWTKNGAMRASVLSVLFDHDVHGPEELCRLL